MGVSQESTPQRKQSHQRIPIVHPKKPSAHPSPSSRSSQQKINRLQPRLLNLLNGDRAGAERLLRHAKQNNPGMSETWYFEKVIHDIERDRR
jgi:hypothetical protein